MAEKKCKGSQKAIGTCCAPTTCQSGYTYIHSDDGGGSCYKMDAKYYTKRAECEAEGNHMTNACQCDNGKYHCKLSCSHDTNEDVE